MKCLTLMASAGLRPEWNDRTRSKHYKAIPITDDRFSIQFPMLSQTLDAIWNLRRCAAAERP
jgi:hypothetical protein